MDFHVLGVQTNIGYLLDVLAHPGFTAGDIDTGFLGREFRDWSASGDVPQELAALVAAAGTAGARKRRPTRPAWELADSWRLSAHRV
jgi:acetyl/propionyl-CoA carboxylase alpha subunit